MGTRSSSGPVVTVRRSRPEEFAKNRGRMRLPRPGVWVDNMADSVSKEPGEAKTVDSTRTRDYGWTARLNKRG